MRYYIVIAKCGHVGKGKYIDVSFPVLAETGKDAANLILRRSKVKKQLKNAITAVYEVNEDIYNSYLDNSFFSDYLKSHFKREFDLNKYDVKELELDSNKKKQEFDSRRERITYILKRYKQKYSYDMEVA